MWVAEGGGEEGPAQKEAGDGEQAVGAGSRVQIQIVTSSLHHRSAVRHLFDGGLRAYCVAIALMAQVDTVVGVAVPMFALVLLL